jgi:hypothetical protein
MLDDIELNINSTKKNVQKAETKLGKAKKWHLSAKKVRLLIISIESLLLDNYRINHNCSNFSANHIKMTNYINLIPTWGRLLENA